MGYINSKKYGTGVQLYKKENKDTSYYITYEDESNKLKRIKIGDKSKGITENYCNQKRIEIINSINLGEEPPALARKKKKVIITLDEIGDKYFKIREAHIVVDVKYILKNYPKRLRDKFGKEDIDSITSDRIFDFQIELKRGGWANSTINYTINFLARLFNFAIEEEIYHKANPVKNKKIKNLKVNNNRERYLTSQEIKILYSKLNDDTLQLFTNLALSTGGRLETILQIQAKDINLSDRMITLKDLKNHSNYKGFIPDDLLAYLKEYLPTLSVNDFVVGGKSIKFADRTLRRKMKNIFDPLFNEGLDSKDAKNRVVIHSLRHTFASHLAINGTPIFTIQKLMNHRDIKMTMRYAKLAPDSGKNFVNKLYA
jgi:integrase